MKMMNTGHLTNFIVIHTVWILLVVDALSACFMLFFITQSCNYWYVTPMQLNSFLWTSLGLITLSARLVDKEFRKAIVAMFGRQAEERTVVQNHLLSARSLSVVHNPNYKFTIFESLHLKVSYRQFILDSLISLSFYLARESIFSSDGVES